MGGELAQVGADVRVAELAQHGFSGPTYEVFENDLCRRTMPVLRGMLRSGKMARLSQQRHHQRGIALYVHPDDQHILHSNAEARDEIAVDILLSALPAFRRNPLVRAGWSAQHAGRHGASCLTTYFIGQCVWDFRRVYIRWRKRRRHLADHEAAMWDPESFHRLLHAPSHVAEPDAIVLGNALSDLITSKSTEVQAIVRLTNEGYTDSEIAERLKTTPGAVRMHLYRLRRTIKAAARAGRVWIPEQLRGGQQGCSRVGLTRRDRSG